MIRVRGRRSAITLLFLAIAAMFLAVPGTPSPANAAWGSYLTSTKYWSILGMNMVTTSSGYQYNYGCSGKDCDKVSNVYAYVGRTGGEVKGNKARIRASVAFTGASMSISAGGSLSGPSGSIGITAYDKSCGMADWWDSEDGRRSVALNSEGTFCKASTWAWLCSVKLSATGAVRIAGTWYTATASDTEDIGC